MKKSIFFTKMLDILKDSAVFLLMFICVNILLTSVLFLLHISITAVNIVLSLGATILLSWLMYRKKDKKALAISACLAVLILIVSIFIASHTYDMTWDGNTYHKLAVGMLKDGWNPVYESAEEYIARDVTNIGLEDDGRNSIWIEHYPKASWIFSANVYSVTGDIESSKIITMLMMYIAFSIVINYMYKKVNIVFSLIIATLIAINPITMVQAFSYYIDGLMGLCIYITLCVLLALSDKEIKDEQNSRCYEKENWLILALTLIICINLKFTGLVYSAIFCIMFFVLWLIRAYKEGTLKEKLISYIKYYVVVVLVAVCVVGFSSYVKNLFVKGNPLYPLMGKNKVDIMTYNEPKSFPERGAIDKFFTSMFAVSENVKSNSTDKDPTLKIPFTIQKEELGQFIKPDTRMAGFGVWFSGIFIISVIGIVYTAYLLLRDKEYEKLGLLIAFLIISVFLVLITDGSWWARYVPYIYLLPILVVYLLARKASKLNHICAYLLSLLLIINVSIISIVSCKYYLKSYRNIEKQIRVMREIEERDGNVTIALRSNAFSCMLYNIKDKGITIKLEEKENLENPIHVNYYYYNLKNNKEEIK